MDRALAHLYGDDDRNQDVNMMTPPPATALETRVLQDPEFRRLPIQIRDEIVCFFREHDQFVMGLRDSPCDETTPDLRDPIWNQADALNEMVGIVTARLAERLPTTRGEDEDSMEDSSTMVDGMTQLLDDSQRRIDSIFVNVHQSAEEPTQVFHHDSGTLFVAPDMEEYAGGRCTMCGWDRVFRNDQPTCPNVACHLGKDVFQVEVHEYKNGPFPALTPLRLTLVRESEMALSEVQETVVRQVQGFQRWQTRAVCIDSGDAISAQGNLSQSREVVRLRKYRAQVTSQCVVVCVKHFQAIRQRAHISHNATRSQVSHSSTSLAAHGNCGFSV